SRDRQGQFFAGLYQGRGKVFNLHSCHLVSPWFAEALRATRSWAERHGVLAYHPDSDTGSLRTLIAREARSSGDRLLMLTVSGRSDFALTAEQTRDWTQSMQEYTPPGTKLSLFLRVQQIQKGQPTQFFEMHLGGPEWVEEQLQITRPGGKVHTLDFAISPSAFFQPNTRQAEHLYSAALSMVDIDKTSTVFDLYCGTGTLGLCLAREAAYVLGIELSQEASLDARENAIRNGIENYHVITGDVGQILSARRSEPDFKAPDLVVVDPPRAGLDATAIEHLRSLQPRQILYISCNPVSQAANIEELKAAGYAVRRVRPLDQTPHTVHIENIVLLERENEPKI
ncbi:MAG: class I SAM-dependent RNA methyltransferase, partial [Chlamydiia bacterium]|nr:class I SAM-dependent RNA methyltransferase [Chlamydiia bacterium]